MKVKDLVEEIEREKQEYPDFLEWDVYTEQLEEHQKERERKEGYSWKDSEDWEYFKCFGFWTKWPERKIFTVNVNY